MELKDTVSLMNSSDYRDRFRAEYFQVRIRKEKLEVMLKKYIDNALDFTPKCSYDILNDQLYYMNYYLDVLEARASIEDIQLND